MDSAKTRVPHAATRFVATAVGVLSYQQLAPLLAERVANVELDIFDRCFAATPLSDLPAELHRRVCADLTPAMAGIWRRKDVQVSAHQAPSFTQVPELMRRYACDLDAQLSAPDHDDAHRLVETLAFAEGRLLFIHPFEDFNGRVSRLLLREMLRRLELPIIDFNMPGQARARYFAALQSYDQNDPRPLMKIWRQRLSAAAPA